MPVRDSRPGISKLWVASPIQHTTGFCKLNFIGACHTHLLSYYLRLFSWYIDRVEWLWQRSPGLQCQKYLLSGPLRKGLPTSVLDSSSQPGQTGSLSVPMTQVEAGRSSFKLDHLAAAWRIVGLESCPDPLQTLCELKISLCCVKHKILDFFFSVT